MAHSAEDNRALSLPSLRDRFIPSQANRRPQSLSPTIPLNYPTSPQRRPPRTATPPDPQPETPADVETRDQSVMTSIETESRSTLTTPSLHQPVRSFEVKNAATMTSIPEVEREPEPQQVAQRPAPAM